MNTVKSVCMSFFSRLLFKRKNTTKKRKKNQPYIALKKIRKTIKQKDSKNKKNNRT